MINKQDMLALVGEHSGYLREQLRLLLAEEAETADKYKNETARLTNSNTKMSRGLEQIQKLGDQVTIAEAKRIAAEALQ